MAGVAGTGVAGGTSSLASGEAVAPTDGGERAAGVAGGTPSSLAWASSSWGKKPSHGRKTVTRRMFQSLVVGADKLLSRQEENDLRMWSVHNKIMKIRIDGDK